MGDESIKSKGHPSHEMIHMGSSIKKVLVTGSSGTIGTYLCEQLLAKGYQVVGLDRQPNMWNRDVHALTNILDLRDGEALGQVKGKFDLIIHLAANARVYNLVKNPTLARDNLETLFNILEFARKNKVPRFIFSSSREVYGNSDKPTHTEDEAYVKNCESPYTASKIGGEALVHSYHQCYGIEFIIVRFSNVYGMYDATDRLIPLFIQKTLAGEPLTVYGRNKLLDFTHISDTVDGVMRCIEKFTDVKNDTFNIASGKGTSLLEVAQLIKSILRAENQIIIDENRTGEIVKFIADISKAKETIGYEPKITIVEGLQRSIEWYKPILQKTPQLIQKNT